MSAVIVNACQWIEGTAWSTGLRESIWVYPIIESLHVLTLCVFLGLTVVMDARLIGIVLPETPVSHVMRRLLPWIRSAFAVLLITGVLLFLTTPVKFYGNIFFRLKALFLIAAGANVWLFHRRWYPTVDEWGYAGAPPRGARMAGVLSLLLWVSIVTVGRLIAYNWFE